MKRHYIFIILAIFLLAVPVSANVTYSQEYYQINEQLNLIPQNNRISIWESGIGVTTTFWDGVQYFQMEKQNILLEKQNELQAELIKAQWVETCYAPHYNGMGTAISPSSLGNYSAWKSECANAGYPVG